MILAAVAALTLASCAKIDTIKVEENTGAIPVAFSNYVPRSMTKASSSLVDGAALANNTHFGVYAWATAYTGNNPTPLSGNPGTPNFMSNVDVNYLNDTNTGSGNTYSPLRFWPSGDKPDYLSFTAYYPYNGAGITAPTFSANTAGEYAFTAQNEAANMIDFMVADVVNDQVYGATNKYGLTSNVDHKGTVQFTFRHQLTKVQFKFKKSTGLGATTVVELLDAKLAGIQNQGTLTATYHPAVAEPAAAAYTSTAWSDQTGAQGYEIFVNSGENKKNPEYTAPSTVSNPVTLADDATTTVDNSAIFLMVPQTMEDATQQLSVTWRVRVYDTAGHASDNAGTAVGGLLSETISTSEARANSPKSA